MLILKRSIFPEKTLDIETNVGLITLRKIGLTILSLALIAV
jgi:hypothetical protein